MARKDIHFAPCRDQLPEDYEFVAHDYLPSWPATTWR